MKVFISATREDLETYHSKIREFLQEKNHEVLELPATAAPGDRLRQVRLLIEQADAFIGVYAHRYGRLPRGEHKSFAELAYDHAVHTGKAIACFVVDPAAPWPEAHREDDFIKQTRLEHFLDRLRQQQEVIPFFNIGDILHHLGPLVQQWSEVYDRLEHLHVWAQKLPAAQKMTAITGLAACYRDGVLSREAFARATALIAGDFSIEKSDPAYPMVEPVVDLLQGRLSAADFAAGLSTVAGIPQRGERFSRLLSSFWQGKNYAAIALIALPALLLGFVLASLLPGNGGGDFPARPALAETAAGPVAAEPAPPEAPEGSVAEELVPVATVASPSSRSGAAAEHPSARRPETSPPTAQSSADALSSTIPAGAAADRQPLSQNEAGEPPAGGPPAKKHTIASPPKNPGKSETPAPTDSIAPEPSPLPGAALANPDALVICEAVNRETRMPEAVSDTLRTSTIWMWTRIATQRPDEVRAEWYFDGRLLGDKSAQIPVASPGYRVYFSRYIGENVRGSGRLKLYNGNGELIGERAFFVDSGSAN